MSSLERLFENYDRLIALPLADRLPPAQRVWFVVYSPEQERRIRFLWSEFKIRAEKHGKEWQQIDVTDLVPEWIAAQGTHGAAYLKNPASLDEQTIQEGLSELLIERISSLALTPSTLCVLVGLSGLFGFASVSSLVKSIQDHDLIPGRLVCFFPGSRDQNSFHFMNARDGWNYHALPITDEEGFLHQ
jgi:hypothetical protein